MKKTLIIALTAVAALGSATILTTNKNFMTLADVECHHECVNHYTEHDATYTESGVKEYWICCGCHEMWFEAPTNSYNDLGDAFVTVDENDDRYIAPYSASILYQQSAGVRKIEDKKNNVCSISYEAGDQGFVLCRVDLPIPAQELALTFDRLDCDIIITQMSITDRVKELSNDFFKAGEDITFAAMKATHVKITPVASEAGIFELTGIEAK